MTTKPSAPRCHLVTGGSGFLGNLIARRLCERGERVKVLDVWEDPTRPREIQFIRCDIRDREESSRPCAAWRWCTTTRRWCR